MASYLDIAGDVGDRRHWYVCGPDPGLRDAAYHELREVLGARASRAVLLDGNETTPEQLRALLLAGQEPWEDAPALLVLMSAEKVDMSFLMDERPADVGGLLLAQGTEERAPEADRRYAHFFRRQSARMVRCYRPESDARLMRWVQNRAGCFQDAAAALVDRSAGDTAWLATEVRKVRAVALGEALRPEHVSVLCTEAGGTGLVTALVDGQKALALRRIPGRGEARAVLGELERVTVKGALVHETQKNVGWSARLLTERTGLSPKELGILRARLNTFDRHATERRLTMLARASERAAQGSRDAWLSLIAAW